MTESAQWGQFIENVSKEIPVENYFKYNVNLSKRVKKVFLCWEFPPEMSKKKGKGQKVNFSLKNMSYYSAFSHLNHFFQPICSLGVIFLKLF